MSHDLGFFSFREGITTTDVRNAYLESCKGGNVSWPASASLDNFVQSLEDKYPCIDTLPDEDLDDSPWACGFDKGDGYIIVSMAFSQAEDVGNFIWSLLEKNKLIVFDPQADKAYINDLELKETKQEKKWWEFWR